MIFTPGFISTLSDGTAKMETRIRNEIAFWGCIICATIQTIGSTQKYATYFAVFWYLASVIYLFRIVKDTVK